MNSNERKMLADALKRYHDCAFTPGVYEHSIVGQAALIIEQFVEVVRCKDCIEVDGMEDGLYHCPYCTDLKKADDFCSHGERKMVNLEDIVNLDAQTKTNNEAMRKVIDFIAGERREGE